MNLKNERTGCNYNKKVGRKTNKKTGVNHDRENRPQYSDEENSTLFIGFPFYFSDSFFWSCFT